MQIVQIIGLQFCDHFGQISIKYFLPPLKTLVCLIRLLSRFIDIYTLVRIFSQAFRDTLVDNLMNGFFTYWIQKMCCVHVHNFY